MQKLLLAIAIIAVAAIAIDAALNTTTKKWPSYEEARKEAEKDGKRVLLMISSETCPKCRYFKEAFSSPEIAKKISEKFILAVEEYETSPVKIPPPAFCIYADNFSCFYADSIDELLLILAEKG